MPFLFESQFGAEQRVMVDFHKNDVDLARNSWEKEMTLFVDNLRKVVLPDVAFSQHLNENRF